MPTFEWNGTTHETDENGYLVHHEEWNEEVARFIAQGEGITLSPAHWEVIRFLRSYYAKYRIAPMIRILMKEVREKLGADKGNSHDLYSLFPEGPAKQACKIAGLPKPIGCV